MLRVVIIGDPDSGKTTALGLLYATQVRSATDKMDAFRFHMPVESLEVIDPIFQQLMSGSFPDAIAKEGIAGISFQVPHRRTGLGIVPRLRGRGGPDASTTIRIALPRTRVEEASRLLRESSVVDDRWNDIYGSDVVVVVVDSTKLAAKGERAEPSPMSRYDAAVESLLMMIQRLREPTRRGFLHPIFLFTKFDRVGPEVLRASKVAQAPPRVGESRARAAYAEALLGHNMPNTLARVKARVAGGPRFGSPVYLFSWVRSEEMTPGPPERIRLRRTETAGWGPDYPHLEYLALLEYVRELAERTAVERGKLSGSSP